MQQTQQKRAWQRGVRAAIFYKKLRLIFLKIDRRCVMAVQRSDLPAWCGHIPIISLLIGSLIAFAIKDSFLLAQLLSSGELHLHLAYSETMSGLMYLALLMKIRLSIVLMPIATSLMTVNIMAHHTNRPGRTNASPYEMIYAVHYFPVIFFAATFPTTFAPASPTFPPVF